MTAANLRRIGSAWIDPSQVAAVQLHKPAHRDEVVIVLHSGAAVPVLAGNRLDCDDVDLVVAELHPIHATDTEGTR